VKAKQLLLILKKLYNDLSNNTASIQFDIRKTNAALSVWC